MVYTVSAGNALSNYCWQYMGGQPFNKACNDRLRLDSIKRGFVTMLPIH